MADKYFADQLDDEELLLVFRKHPIIMRKGLIVGLLALMLGTVPSLIKPEYSYLFGGLAVGLIVGILLFLPYWIQWYYSVFIVTNQRFIQTTQKGMFHKQVVDLNLQQIKSLNYEVAGIEQTVLGFGTILIQTYIGDLVIHDVQHPEKVVKSLAQILRDEGIEPTTEPYEEKETEINEEKA